MSKNPLLNALAAAAYIVLVVSVMTLGTKIAPRPNAFIAPLAVVSLFTLSAAVMGYIFCFEPAQLYFDGKKKQAVRLFLQTVMVFGCMTAATMVLHFSGVFSQG